MSNMAERAIVFIVLGQVIVDYHINVGNQKSEWMQLLGTKSCTASFMKLKP